MKKRKRRRRLRLRLRGKDYRINIFWALTVSVVLMGVLFAQLLSVVFTDKEDQQSPGAIVSSTEGGSEDSAEILVANDEDVSEEAEVNEENVIYVMQLGVFENFENFLSLQGEIRQLGYDVTFVQEDGKYHVFSHIVSEREQLAPVEEAMTQNEITHVVRALEISTDELRWLYFLKAVQQIPFEIEPDFIEIFDLSELHIFGYYVAISSTDFDDVLTTGRQDILREMYQWLRLADA